MHDPATTTTSYTPPSHPYTMSPVAVSHGVPETEPQQLGFGFSTQNRSSPCISQTTQRPPLPFHMARLKPSHSGSVSDFGPKFAPRHHHYLVYTTTPPLRNVPHCCFTQRTQNRATAARFQIFDPNPLPTSHFTNAQPHHHHHHHHHHLIHPLLLTSISNGAPTTEPQWLGFRFLAFNLIYLNF